MLKKALIFSVVAHAFILALSFVPEDKFKPWDTSALNIVLVNGAGEIDKPDKAQVLAQANSQGGGEADAGLHTVPTPEAEVAADGTSLSPLSKKVQQLETEQAALLAALRTQVNASAAAGASIKPTPTVAQAGKDASDASEMLRRQLAVLDKKVQDYNARPKRFQLSPATREVIYARYYARWSDKVEKYGTRNYPEAARGLSGGVVLTVSIKPNGRIATIEIAQGSGSRKLDKAAIALVRSLVPYEIFPAEWMGRIDVLDITTRIVFTDGEGVTAELMSAPARERR